MCFLYRILFAIGQRWIYVALALILTTIVFSFWGHSIEVCQLGWRSIGFQTIKLFLVDGSFTDGDVGWPLEVARWLGVVVWSFTIATFLIGLFKQTALTFFVRLAARGHIVVCGLGNVDEGRERLVKRLRSQGRDVVVLEPNPSHPSLDTCRATGAVCLTGAAEEVLDLKRAQVKKASTVIVLGSDDRRNIDLLGNASILLTGNRKLYASETEQPLDEARQGNVNFVLQVCEPGLMDVLKHHRLHTDPCDRMHLRLFSAHEMAARAMLRESMLGPNMPVPRKILLVGVGSEGRMGEALVMRAIKDSSLEHLDPLEIHVLDRDSDNWCRCVTERACFLYDFHGVVPIQGIASRCGFRSTDSWKGVVQEKYDAVFVCIADEAIAVMQAARLANALAGAGQEQTPIIVRVREEQTGFGKLFHYRGQEGLPSSIRPVGTDDRVYDVVTSMHPTVELVAQALHQDYLALNQQRIREADNLWTARRIADHPAVRTWTELDDKYKQSNRALARRLKKLLTITTPDGQVTRRFTIEFAPTEVIHPNESFRLSSEELERLAQMEHENWMAEQAQARWQFGDPDLQLRAPAGVTYNKNMVPWSELDEEIKEYDRNIVRRLPFVLAKADYKLVEVMP